MDVSWAWCLKRVHDLGFPFFSVPPGSEPRPTPLKLLSVFLMSVKNPSLNDLQLAGLICQLATLACGLLCVTINRPDVNFVIGCCSLAAMGCFVALVLHFWHVSLAAVLADRYQEKTRYHEKVSREPTASAKKTPI